MFFEHHSIQSVIEFLSGQGNAGMKKATVFVKQLCSRAENAASKIIASNFQLAASLSTNDGLRVLCVGARASMSQIPAVQWTIKMQEAP